MPTSAKSSTNPPRRPLPPRRFRTRPHHPALRAKHLLAVAQTRGHSAAAAVDSRPTRHTLHWRPSPLPPRVGSREQPLLQTQEKPLCRLRRRGQCWSQGVPQTRGRPTARDSAKRGGSSAARLQRQWRQQPRASLQRPPPGPASAAWPPRPPATRRPRPRPPELYRQRAAVETQALRGPSAADVSPALQTPCRPPKAPSGTG